MVTLQTMIRILQLLDHEADFETRRAAAGLERALGNEFSVRRRSIGFGGDWRDVATATAHVRRSGDPFDLVHAFGGRALTVAALGTHAPIVFLPVAETRGRTVSWLRAVMAHRKVEVVCPTSTLRRRMVERGVPLERCHLIRPGVEFARVQRRRDDALREQLGLSRDDYVLLAAGESTRGAAHSDAAWATTILHVADPRYKLLLWGRGAMAPAVKRFAHKVDRADAVIVAEERLRRRMEFEELLPAVDAVLASARGRVATLPIAIAMAAGLPIISTVTYTLGELLEDRHTALMTPAGKPRQLARRVLDLVEDPSLQWTISDMARTEAYEFFAFTRFVNQFRDMFRQIARGEKVVVSEQAPGAGLRFHGRA